jgi:2-polyprenyl-6-methoxyphenol hydroxylase-like FAD-dependent oxidoreductase
MRGTLDIAIAGYGTAGQASALFLSRAGHRVRVFERTPVLGPVGAGILLQPTGQAVLADLGLLDRAVACGGRVDRLIGHNLRGRSVMDMRYAHLHPSWFGLGLQRGTLFELLRTAYAGASAIVTGCEITAMDAEAGMLADASGRSHGPFDLIIAADGAGSTLRKGAAPKHIDKQYPWGALWCLCADPERRFDGQLGQRYDKARRMAGVLPVGHLPGEDSQRHRVSFFWSLPLAEMDPWRTRGIARWKEEVHDYWPEVADLLGHIQQPEQLARASYRDVILKKPHRGRAVWLGDAAHAMSPQLGQGANLALLDAQGLSLALEAADDVPSALVMYAKRRRQHVKVYQFVSRWLTPLFQSNRDVVAWMRDIGFGPLGKMPIASGQMLQVLAGIKNGWLGSLPLDRFDVVRSDALPQTQDSGGT